jgi:hypothetical protein
MKKALYTFHIILFLFLFSCSMLPLTVGSDTEVSIEPFTSFPAVDLVAANKILAFAWMQNGFEFEDQTTSCTFASVYPVSVR